MSAEAKVSKLQNSFVTIPVVWVIVIAAGGAGMKLQPSLGGAVLSLTAYTALLFAFSRFTTIGRSAGLMVYLSAVPLYLPACLILFMLLGGWQFQADAPLPWLDLLTAGGWVGFMASNDGFTVPGLLILLALNLLGPILIVIGLRDFRLAKS
jgi:hypothetical protein